MFEHWAVIWTVLQHERRPSRKGLDDPLDGPEWKGLHWVLPVFSFLGGIGGRARLPAAPAPGAGSKAGAVRCCADPATQAR
jgi:hypothetical protein